MRIYIKDVFRNELEYFGKEITLEGWVRTVRDNKNFGFIELNDGSFFKSIQVVFDNNLSNFDEVAKLGVGSSVSVTGILAESPGEKQSFELKSASIKILQSAPQEYPLQKKRHTFEYLRTISHLRPRTNTFAAVFRIRSLASFAIHKFFTERNYVYVHTPIITASDCEGAGETFTVTTFDMEKVPMTKEGKVDFKEDFFGKMASLSVSGQLHGETFALAFSNIYTFGPTFRAENSNTTRHACEFWMMEPEIAFADLIENMNVAEEMTKYIINYVLENAPEEIEFLNSFVDKELVARLKNVVESDFGRITYSEAIEILEKAEVKFDFPVHWGMDIQTEHERYLAERVFKRPVFVTDYPKEIKSFYMRQNDDGKTVAAMDLLVPGIGELIGGSQREERYDVLIKRMEELNMDIGQYWWYLDLRRYGSVICSGFGIGFERLVMYITGMSNIRDVIPFARTVHNAEF